MQTQDTQTLLVLGRQPLLGLAELESLYGVAVQPFGPTAALVSDAAVDFQRLGGSLKAGSVLATVSGGDWKTIEKALARCAREQAAVMPEGKVTLGLSAYGLKVRPAALTAYGLTLKKIVRAGGRSVRLVPNNEPALNTAQTLHNNLAGEHGLELLVVHDGRQTVIARTTAVQDIDSYTLRDRGRPKRDARVGMLPPKLAQIIINLSLTTPGGYILDPFCGTGVVLQEALLMGYSVYGTDIEPRMIEYSNQNLEWLKQQASWVQKNVNEHRSQFIILEVQDAKKFMSHNHDISGVACETYLGRPFTSLPPPELLQQTVSECNLIIKKFLRSIHEQLQPGIRLCLAIPAWQIAPGRFKHLPMLSGDLDQITDMGYNRVSFEHVASSSLLYYREDQIVARQLLVLEKQ